MVGKRCQPLTTTNIRPIYTIQETQTKKGVPCGGHDTPGERGRARNALHPCGHYTTLFLFQNFAR